MGRVSALERTSFLVGLLCLGTGSEDAEALSVYQTPLCISATVEAEPIMNCWFPPMEAKGIAYILWYRGTEKLLPSDEHFKRSENISAGSASLRIPRVQAEDAGVYICEVGNITCILKGNGTKLEVHGAGQTSQNQTATEGCVHVTAPIEDEAPMALIVGLTFLLLTLSLIIVCYFKWRKQETTEEPFELYSKPKGTTEITQEKEKHLQPEATTIPNDDSVNYAAVCFHQEYLEAAQRNEETATLYAPVKKKKSPAFDEMYAQP